MDDPGNDVYGEPRSPRPADRADRAEARRAPLAARRGDHPLARRRRCASARGRRQRLNTLFCELGLITREDWDELDLRVAQLEHRLRLIEEQARQGRRA